MYCRECGHELSDQVIDGRVRHVCPGCGYIDWDNWINAAVVVVPYNPQGEFLMVRLGGAEDGSLTCPGGFRELGETLPEAARRETLEETGHAVVDLELFKVYTWNAKRLLWVVYKARLGKGQFVANAETKELLFFSPDNPPPADELRGPLTERLIRDVLADDSAANDPD